MIFDVTKNQLDSSKKAQHLEYKQFYLKFLLGDKFIEKNAKNIFSIKWSQPALTLIIHSNFEV